MSSPSRATASPRLSVLSNATMVGRPGVAEALNKVDNNILKLDSAIPATLRALNRPVSANVLPEGIIADIKQFAGQCVVQTMMLRGSYEGHVIDNTTPAEVDALIEAYRQMAPRQVMLYSIDRPTPATELKTVPREELQPIADRIAEATGLTVTVS